jgi:hypothetical protein
MQHHIHLTGFVEKISSGFAYLNITTGSGQEYWLDLPSEFLQDMVRERRRFRLEIVVEDIPDYEADEEAIEKRLKDCLGDD